MSDQPNVVKDGPVNVVIRPRADLADIPRAARNLSATLAGGLGDALRKPMHEFVSKLAEGDGGKKPSEIELKFGLTFEGGVDWCVTLSSEASLEVTIKWKP